MVLQRLLFLFSFPTFSLVMMSSIGFDFLLPFSVGLDVILTLPEPGLFSSSTFFAPAGMI